jgi:DHA2 family multidrug resistance protein
MAQASGLFNTIRQIGGSFGVAMFGALLTRRVIYHSGNYGQAINQNSEIFKHTVSTMKNMVKYSSGGSGSELIMKSKLLIAKNAIAQAFVQGINDDFFLASVITLVLLIPMMFLKISKIKNQEKIELID